MASSNGTVGARRRSMDLFDPTAYAARRKEKVEAAAALREQRKKEQEKRESDRGSAPPANGDGPNYLKPLLRRSLTSPATPPPKEPVADPPKPADARPSPNSSSFAQALPPFRSPSTKKPKNKPAVSSPPRMGAELEETPPVPEPAVEIAPAPLPDEDTENQAPAPARLAIVEKKPSPAKMALSLLKAKLRLSKPKPAPASPYQDSPPAVAVQAAPQRTVLSPTQGQNQGVSSRAEPRPAVLRDEGRRLSGDFGDAQEAEVRKEGESLGSKLARALGPRKKKESEGEGGGSVAGEKPAQAQPAGRQAQPAPERQAPVSEMPEEGDVSTRPCPDCGRNFSEVALAKHAKICRKVFGQKRKAFNVAAHRLEGTDAAKFVQQQGAGRGAKGGASGRGGRGDSSSWAQGGRSADARPLTKVPAWKQQSQQLQAAIQASRQYSQAKARGVDPASLPPPPPAENLDYVPCPHCSRRFAPQVAERHIPKCKDTINRPKPIARKPAQEAPQKRKGK